jgi:alanine racemase
LYGYEQPYFRGGAQLAEVTPLPLKPVLSWKTHVLGLRDVPAGQALGYGGAYVTPVAARIAIVSVGYGDCLSRKFSMHAGQMVSPCETDPAIGRGEVLVRGQRAPVVGRVSMDLTLLDVTHIPSVAIGDEVVLIGRSGEERITAWDLAHSSDTVVYETLCNLSKRVPRRHAE